MAGGGGEGGRSLSDIERDLISQQINSSQLANAQSFATFQQGQMGAQQSQQQVWDLIAAANNASNQITPLAGNAVLEGERRRNREVELLNNLGMPGVNEYGALRGQIQDPQWGHITNLALQRALNPQQSPAEGALRNMMQLGLGGATSAPVQAQVAQLGGMGASTPAANQVNMLQHLGSNQSAAAQAAQLGALGGQTPAANQVNVLQHLGMSPAAAAQAAQLGALAGQSPATLHSQNLTNIGMGPLAQNRQTAGLNQAASGLESMAQRAAGIGATPGAAEQAMTPQAIQMLSAAQRGQVPSEIANLYSGVNTAARTGLETQFNAARERLMESGVRGGALTRALAGLEGQRAMGISEQINAREAEARAATANLMGQATTYGLNQPFAREQLNLQGIGTGGGLLQSAGGLRQAGGQLDINESLARQQALSSAGGMALNQLQTQGGLLQQSGQLGINDALQRQQALSTAGNLGINQLQTQGGLLQQSGQLGINDSLARAQALGTAGSLGVNQMQAQTGAMQASGQLGLGQGQLQQGYLDATRQAATSLGDQALGFAGLGNQNLALAGQLATQQFNAGLAANQARTANLTQQLGAIQSIAGQYGQGADNLAYQVAPGLASQLIAIRQAAAQAPGIPVDILRGTMSGQGADLGAALQAASAAASYDPGPSRGAAAASGALSGAAAGTAIMPGWGTAIGAGVGLIGGLLA